MGCPAWQQPGLGIRLTKNQGLQIPLLELGTQPLLGLENLLARSLAAVGEKETRGRHRGDLEVTVAVSLPQSRYLF